MKIKRHLKPLQRFVLLGAGASVDAGIKDAFEMTREFIRLFAEDHSCRQQSHALRYVVGGLLMQKGANGEDPFLGVNIEDVFNAMQTLATRQLFDAAPFVVGWHSVVENIDVLEPRFNPQRSSRQIASSIDSAISDHLQQKGSRRSVGDEVRKLVESLSKKGDESLAGEGRVFRATCDTMVKKLISLVWLKSDDQHRVQYLRPLVRYSFQHNVPIATLNYDTTIEIAAEAESLYVHTFMGGGVQVPRKRRRTS